MNERRIRVLGENVPGVDPVNYGGQLSRLEHRFGVDLSASRLVPMDHVAEVRGFGHMVADYIGRRKFISPKRVVDLHERVDACMLFTPDDKKDILVSSAREPIVLLESVKDEYVAQGVWDQVPKDQIAVYDSRLKQHKKILDNLLAGVSTCATTFGFDEESGEQVHMAGYLDWGDNNDPYSHCSLEGSVAEETFHLGSNLSNLQFSFPEIRYGYLHDTEELAVKYYVVEVLRDLGVAQDRIDLYISMDPTTIPVWQNFIDDVGRGLADKFFFLGKASPSTMERLIVHRTNEFANEEKGDIV